MMARMTVTALVAACVILIAGCALARGVPEEAKAIGEQYYEAAKAMDLDRMVSLYSPSFYDLSNPKLTEAEWRARLAEMREKLGELEDYRLTDSSVRTFAGTGAPPGTYYELAYEVKYSKHKATEKITIFKPVNGGDQDLKILGYSVASTAFAQ